MRNVDQYESYSPPLTVGARIIRGFRRVGLVLAVPIIVFGIPASLYGGYNNYDSKARKEAQASCLLDKALKKQDLPVLSYDKTKIDPEAAGCKGPLYSVYPWEFPAYAKSPASFVDDFAPVGLGGSLAAILGAIILYGFFWAVGWVIAGFTRD